MRILIVDDHPHFTPIVVEQFLADHEVTVAASLAEARETMMRGSVFDVVLVDYDLPDGKGAELVRELRKAGYPGRLVGISARELGNEELLAAGADAICPKGRFHTSELSDSLQPPRAS